MDINYRLGDTKEYKRLEDLFDVQSTGLDKKIDSDQTMVKMINYLDVYNNKVDISSLSYTTGNSDKINGNLVTENDILITPTSETPNDIFNSHVFQGSTEKIVYSYHLMKLTPKIPLNSLYYKYFFDNSNFRKEISKYATGSTRFTLSKKDILNLSIPYIPIVNQNKIANLFNHIDIQISNYTKQRELLEQKKKHYLNVIFNDKFE